MLLKIQHKTRYTYDAPVPYGLQQLRLWPKSGPQQTILNWDVQVAGAERQTRYRDHNNNDVELVRLDEASSSLIVTSHGEVETEDTNGIMGMHQGCAPLWFFRRQTDLTRPGKSMTALLRSLSSEAGQDVGGMHALMHHIADQVRYRKQETSVTTTAEEAVLSGSGVCQDHTHIFVGLARALGFPARYVSGYLHLESGEEQEASHAWAEVFIDALGWVGFDISNRICPNDRYIRLATGLDYRDAAPISGIRFGGGDETLLVTVQVEQ